MNLLLPFRFSTYLSLALACGCLGYAEGALLPESPYITGAVILLLAIAYRLEGRWSLSLRAANIVGGGLTLILVGWIAFQFVRKPPEIMAQLAFPAFLLPYLGPVLMILIAAKLFRPKHNGDYWAMHGIGMLAVCLGCAMANDLFFGVLLVVYLCCFAWSMALFHLYREARDPDLSRPFADNRSHTYLFRSAGRWSMVIAIAGLLVFLATPRPNHNKWELPMAMRGRAEVGLSEGNVDLNRSGSLEQSNELAFTVEAKDAQGAPKLDLDPNQRWRASSLVTYEGGKWMRGRELERPALVPVDRPLATSNEPRRLPDFGPRSYLLTYSMKGPASAMTICASPVLWRPYDNPPIRMFGQRNGPVVQRPDRFYDWLPTPAANLPSYVQVTAATDEADLGPAMMQAQAISPGYLEFLTRMPQGPVGERLRRHTADLLARLVHDGTLSAAVFEDVDPFSRLPSARHHEAIARALERHLSGSGEYRYTTQLDRSDRNLDPIEDFLYNTKSGHCQRFASALTLMLRSQGIPAQFVLGYRGCESVGDGHYEIHQNNAHAWVEAIIYRSPPAQVLPLRLGEELPSASKAQHWLSLDPTPAGAPESDGKEGVANWLEDALSRGESFFKNFVLSYDAIARQKAVDSIINNVEEFGEDLAAGQITWPIAVVGGSLFLLPAILIVRRRFRRARHASREEIARKDLRRILPFYEKLLDLLARHGLTPGAGQTAREFARDVREQLSQSPAAGVADIPDRLVGAYYRVRFGGHSLADSVLNELNAALKQLAEALTATHFCAPTHETT